MDTNYYDMDGKPMSHVTELKYDHLSNDLFWSVYHVDADNHFEKIRWTGYNDGYWWQNVSATEEFLVKECKCGKKFRLHIDDRSVSEEPA